MVVIDSVVITGGDAGQYSGKIGQNFSRNSNTDAPYTDFLRWGIGMLGDRLSHEFGAIHDM